MRNMTNFKFGQIVLVSFLLGLCSAQSGVPQAGAAALYWLALLYFFA